MENSTTKFVEDEHDLVVEVEVCVEEKANNEIVAENEMATQEVARQPSEVGCGDEEVLLERKPNREGMGRNKHVVTGKKEVKIVDNIVIDIDKNEDSDEDCNFIAEYEKILEDCTKDVVFKSSDDKHYEEICIEVADDEDYIAKIIFRMWILEEIRYCYMSLFGSKPHYTLLKI